MALKLICRGCEKELAFTKGKIATRIWKVYGCCCYEEEVEK